MAITTARQGQHDLIQYLKNPKVRERHFIDNPPDDEKPVECPRNSAPADKAG